MAWYYGTFACGCEGRVNIIGPTKDRQWKADRKFEGLCEDCYKKHLEEERQKANEEAAEKSKEMELPELTGTEKQIAWANTLRQKLIERFEDVTKDEETIKKFIDVKFSDLLEIKKEFGVEYLKKLLCQEGISMVLDYILTNKTEAKYYIDNRDEDTLFHIKKNHKEALKMKEEVIKENVEKKIEADIKAEATVRPEDSSMPGSAEITVKDDRITVMYDKNEEFREIVKSLGYTWDGIWTKKIKETTGTAEDRAAELGNKLLNAGFSICILDESIREKAIKGEFEVECKRWVNLRTGGDYKGCLAIMWQGMNDKLYRTSKSIPGAHWNNDAMVLKVMHYKEIEDFAELCGFKFTKSALKAIEEYKEQEKNIEVVSPAKVEKAKPKDGLQEILNSSTDVLDDLKD
jgi:hypothetical protein